MELINFRDFGGHRTQDGGTVRTGRLFRCGHLAELSDEAIRKVTDFDFAVIADLRYAGERVHEPSPWPLDYGERVIFHGGERTTEAPHLAMLRSGSLTPATAEQFYFDFYRDIPFDPLYRPLFAKALTRIAEAEGPVLVHCAAGKDRTGIMCALLLEVLGVPREQIVAEYLRSLGAPALVAMKPKIIRRALRRYGHHVSEEAVDALIGVRPDYIGTAFATIERKEGSVGEYFTRSGVAPDRIEQLRERLLEA